MKRNWFVDGFTEEAWGAMKKTIADGKYSTPFSDFFGGIMCGAVCFDLVLRDIDYDEDGKVSGWELDADPYILGIDSGYGYTLRNTPYDQYDGLVLTFHKHMTYADTLRSFIEQIDEFTVNDATLSLSADRQDMMWKDERYGVGK